MQEKLGKESKRPAWLSRDNSVKLKWKKQMHRQLKIGLVTWEGYKDEVQFCRDGLRKANSKLELNLARDARNNRKGFCRHVNQKRKVNPL